MRTCTHCDAPWTNSMSYSVFIGTAADFSTSGLTIPRMACNDRRMDAGNNPTVLLIGLVDVLLPMFLS